MRVWLFRFVLSLAMIPASKAAAATPAPFIIAAEAYGQGIWYSLRGSYRFHERAMVNLGYSYTEIPPVDAAGKTAYFHIVPVSFSALWQLPFTTWPIHAEILFGGNIMIGSERTERSGVRATVTGQAFTPVAGIAFAWLPKDGGLVVRFACYMFQGIDSQGVESRRLPWLGGSIGFAF
ncbi:MAG: hypothetical protein KF713_18885 [Turneriella sp.]|nr:hypothetical protein [Turneriella sp.]